VEFSPVSLDLQKWCSNPFILPLQHLSVVLVPLSLHLFYRCSILLIFVIIAVVHILYCLKPCPGCRRLQPQHVLLWVSTCGTVLEGLVGNSILRKAQVMLSKAWKQSASSVQRRWLDQREKTKPSPNCLLQSCKAGKWAALLVIPLCHCCHPLLSHVPCVLLSTWVSLTVSIVCALCWCTLAA